MRLFVAVLLSSPVKASLSGAIEELKRQGTGNFTRVENLHMTLAFLGETNNQRGAVRALKAVDAPAFSATLGTVGSYGPLIWAGLEPSPAMMQLQRKTAAQLTDNGFTLEKRPFQPHFTLCRQFEPYGDYAPEKVKAALGAPKWTVTRVSLMQSERVNGTLYYRELFAQWLKPIPNTDRTG